MTESTTESFKELSLDKVMGEFMELLLFWKNEIAVAVLLKEFLEMRHPVIVCDLDAEATRRTGNVVASYKLNEAFMELLLTVRATYGENGKRDGIGGHNYLQELMQGMANVI